MNTTFNAVTDALGWTLIHATWQVAAIVLGVWLLDVVLRRRSAAARYAIHLAGLLVVGVVPLVTFGLMFEPGAVSGPVNGVEMPVTPTSRAVADTLVSGDALGAVFSVTTSAAPMVDAEGPGPHDRMEAWVGSAALQWIVAAWAAGILVGSARLLIGWIGLRRRVGRALPVAGVNAPLAERFEALVESMGVGRRATLLVERGLACPLATGVLRPVVLFSEGLLGSLTPAQVEHLLRHELAHLRRLDPLVLWVQSGVETLLFFHPGVWWLSARLRTLREECCDDLAGAVPTQRREYAGALVALAGVLAESDARWRAPLAAPADGGQLEQRVRRLLGAPARRRRGVVFPAAVVVVAVVMGWGVIAGTVEEVAPAEPAEPAKQEKTTEVDPRFDPNRDPETAMADRFFSADLDTKIAVGDLLEVNVLELIIVGEDTGGMRRVSPEGRIRLPVMGEVQVAGLTQAEAKSRVAQLAIEMGLMQHAEVRLALRLPAGRLWEPAGPLAAGDLLVVRVFELTDIGVDSVKTLQVDSEGRVEVLDGKPIAVAGLDVHDVEERITAQLAKANLIVDATVRVERLSDSEFARFPGSDREVPPLAGRERPTNENADSGGREIIRVDYQRLLNGDLSQNVMIRRGDVILLPQIGQFVYIMGQSNRPGAYTLGEYGTLTLKQLIASSGGFEGLGDGDDVVYAEIIRRVEEGEVRQVVSLSALFAGEEDDVMLAGDDLINVGGDPVFDPASGRKAPVDVLPEPTPLAGSRAPVADDFLPVDARSRPIQPGDVLLIALDPADRLADVPESVVYPDGTIDLEAMGLPRVAGYTPDGLADALSVARTEQGLADAGAGPVRVVVKRAGSGTFSLLTQKEEGATQSGVWPVPAEGMPLIEALPLAGGIEGRRRTVFVVRER